MSEKIDFSSLEKALVTLEDILDQEKNKYIVAGTVQCFEYTFELSWKMMQRVLKAEGVTTGSPMQVLRAAHAAQFIDDFDTWVRFLKERNLTAHTYNEDTAEQVYNSAMLFPPYVKALLKQLKKEE